MKRVFLACVAVVFLFGISSVSFAGAKEAETMKEEGMKKGGEAMGEMKGKGEEMSTDAKAKDMPAKIEAQGKAKSGKAKTGKAKKKPMKEEPMKE